MKEREMTNSQQLELTKKGREKLAVYLWKQDVKSPDCVGYHNTSLETIRHAIVYGTIPGWTEPSSKNPSLPQRGDIYFLPRLTTFPFEKLPNLFKPIEEFALQELEIAASGIAESHRFCSFLKLELATNVDRALFYIDGYYSDFKTRDSKEAKAEFQTLGISSKRLSRAVKAVKKRQGIIIGLKLDSLDKFPLSIGDRGDDFRLQTGNKGLSLNALSCIKPLGEEEIRFLQRLEKK